MIATKKPKADKPPVPAKLNEHGGAVRGVKSIRISIPKGLKAEATINVAYLDPPPMKAGWRAEFDTRWSDGGRGASVAPRSKPFDDKPSAVIACALRLEDYYRNQHGASSAGKKKAEAILKAISLFRNEYVNRHKKAILPGGKIVPQAAFDARAKRPSLAKACAGAVERSGDVERRPYPSEIPRRVEDLDKEIGDFIEAHTGIKDAMRRDGRGVVVGGGA